MTSPEVFRERSVRELAGEIFAELWTRERELFGVDPLPPSR